MERGLLDIRTGEPFAARYRLHHRDEIGLVGASSGISPRARSLITARGLTMGGGEKQWKNPYARPENMFLYWDAEWNAAGGVHDDNLRLSDLSGHGRDAILTGGTVGDNFVINPVGGYVRKRGEYLEFANGATIESVTVVNGVGFTVPMGNVSNGFSMYRVSDGLWWLVTSNEFDGIGTRATTYVYDLPSLKRLSVFQSSHDIVRGSSEFLINGIKKATLNRAGFPGDQYIVYPDINRISFGSANTISYSVRIYNVALTADEMAANFAVDKARFNIA